MVIIVKDVLFFKKSLRKICLHLVLKTKSSKILPSHPMTILTLLMLLESNSLSIRTLVKTPHKVLHKSIIIVVTIVVPIIPDLEPCNNQTIKELPQTVQSFDPKSDLVHNSPNVFNPSPQPPIYSYEFCWNDAYYGKASATRAVANLSTYPSKHFNSFCHDDDDDEDYTIAITPSLSTEEPDNSLSMRDEHLDTISTTESNEFIKSSVENLVPIPCEFEGESECDVPAREEFTTFSNILFDAEYEFDYSDDQSFFDEDVPKKIFWNPLFDEEIIRMKIDQHHYNAESDLIEALRTHDSSIIISSKIDSLFDELLYDNSSPRPMEKFVSDNSDTETESFSPSPVLVEDSDSLMEEINLFFNLDYPMPPGIEDDDYDSKKDILILKDLLSNDTFSFPEIESFHFDIPSFSRPPVKPPDGNTGILNVKMMGDISDQKVPIPKLMITLVPN
uniref:Reverse transcriptase domain-containing protein n=1 Tax=Tanacetum cinerariifolium TaxID=118510 RepID=A0A6L2LJ12_TANCI|nr:hypothetical protein [Tanacetum cinerariifolium]